MYAEYSTQIGVVMFMVMFMVMVMVMGGAGACCKEMTLASILREDACEGRCAPTHGARCDWRM